MCNKLSFLIKKEEEVSQYVLHNYYTKITYHDVLTGFVDDNSILRYIHHKRIIDENKISSVKYVFELVRLYLVLEFLKTVQIIVSFVDTSFKEDCLCN